MIFRGLISDRVPRVPPKGVITIKGGILELITKGDIFLIIITDSEVGALPLIPKPLFALNNCYLYYIVFCSVDSLIDQDKK